MVLLIRIYIIHNKIPHGGNHPQLSLVYFAINRLSVARQPDYGIYRRLYDVVLEQFCRQYNAYCVGTVALAAHLRDYAQFRTFVCVILY